MLDQYAHFFAVSTSASAGFIGLLLVALSVVNRDEQEHRTRERRTVLAASAFLALVDILFISIVSTLGGSMLFAATNLAMAMVGLAGTSRLFLRGKRAGNFAPGIPQRNFNIAYAGVAAGVFDKLLIKPTAGARLAPPAARTNHSQGTPHGRQSPNESQAAARQPGWQRTQTDQPIESHSHPS